MMRNHRVRLALNAVALYQGFAWLSDFLGTLAGTLARGKGLMGSLLQWTHGIKLPHAILVLLIVATATMMNRRYARRPDPEAWYAAGGFLCIRAIFGFISVLITLAADLAQLRSFADGHMWMTSLSFLVSPFLESLMELLCFWASWRIGRRERLDLAANALTHTKDLESIHKITAESILLFFGFTLLFQCLSTPILLLLSTSLRQNAASPYGWFSIGFQTAVLGGLAIQWQRRRKRTVPRQPLHPMSLWIAGTMLAVSALLNLPVFIATLRGLLSTAATQQDASVLQQQQLNFATSLLFIIVAFVCGLSAIALGEREAKKTDAASQSI